MSELNFIVRVIHGKERQALAEAATRVTTAWMPFSFESTRPHRKRRATVTVRPVMGYMFITATAAQRDHLMKARNVFGPVWYVPESQSARIEQYKMGVEAQFNRNLIAWCNNARAFHCRYKPGQAVRLKLEGLDLFLGKFQAVNPDGTYRIESEVMGQAVRIDAEPMTVDVA